MPVPRAKPSPRSSPRSSRASSRRPRAVDPSIPPPLEAICLKAMAFEPEDRYHSARELAHDLEHWLADEPVSAYPERPAPAARALAPPAPDLDLRRRRRPWSGITAGRDDRRLRGRGGRGSEAEARKEAETNFKHGPEGRRRIPHQRQREHAAQGAGFARHPQPPQGTARDGVAVLRGVREPAEHDPKLREQLANAHFRVGEITQAIGTVQDALNDYHRALGLWEPLASSDPGNLEYQSRLADCDLAIGKLTVSENLPQSLEWLDRALKIYERIGAEADGPPLPVQPGACCSEMGLYLSYRKEVGPSLAHLNRARAILQSSWTTIPARSTSRRTWRRSSTGWGMSTSPAATT